MPTPEKKPVEPFHCFTYSNVPANIHHNIRYFCQRAGSYYCADHQHFSNCCRALSFEFCDENWKAAQALNQVMPRCKICGERYLAINRITHMRICLKKYCEMRKAGTQQEMDRLMQEQVQREEGAFVPDSKLEYRMADEVPIYRRYTSSGKVLKEVKFVEEG